MFTHMSLLWLCGTFLCIKCSPTRDGGDGAESLRLAHGRFGQIQILYNNMLGHICSDNLTVYDANVVCRQLGFSGGIYYKLARLFQSEYFNPVLSNLRCNGTESEISECRGYNFDHVQTCHNKSYAAVYCYRNQGPAFRLIGPADDVNTGRVEMAMEGEDGSEWGPVCSRNGLANFTASLLCKELCTKDGYALPRRHHPRVSGPIRMPYIVPDSTQLHTYKRIYDIPMFLHGSEIPNNDDVHWNKGEKYRFMECHTYSAQIHCDS